MKQYRYTKGVVLLGLVALVGLSSCQVTNQYKTPDIDTDNLYGERTSSDTTTIANIPWKEYFSDPSLVALIEEGIENNYNLQIAYTRIQQAEASLGMAKAAYFPDVALVGQVNHSRSSNGAQGKDVLGYHSTNYSLGISVGWELDVWGKLNRQSRAKYAQFLNSHAYKNLIQTSLVANIATSYYSLLALDEKLAITVETVKLMRENVQTMEDLKNAGLQNGAAVEQSKSLLYSTLASIPDLESQIRQLENSLSTMLGRKPGEISRRNISEQQYPTQLEYGIPVQALARRPDVQQAELSFRSAFELTNAAQASFYPSIALSTGSLGYATANTLSNFFKPENLFASIVGGLSQPLFAKKQLIGNLKIAKAQQQEALLTFEQSVLEAGQEVTNILYSFDSSLRKNETREQQIEACKKSVSFTQELLKAGVANYTEVLNAEQNLLSAQLSRVNDRLEQLQCTVNLYKALGGGIE
ncbi:multidrug efflux system outer membrane protein [Parabacteroides sp. PF5-5]|uniref:efflux transporter outer membrane subunit n=1 Tax=unclassified Parabacteroides TaxID=2649774 RepID=UPI0024739AFF|nr:MULTISPECIES: efflux transporter outer membrane subunit [unclassified Parabacteroides]MDH6304739.1 multidrug efflux system outer membrane protein [Parabacteroides sp. PH5-39]MDH6315646.1 multidrug efflux system outer membrane protein [Parabacteroides sp. PF5-13]MDH6319307.1 multidrug efflux system outer membrane protein [Parabacteroides sp. PH5-13]MDH6323038.1 multidrug efflux system outer membrane protein [Parabacteroides sp. PH5-8]MDH6326839.1 multidrug efflux system outer membrane protei